MPKEKPEVVLPFTSDAFKELWEDWISFRKEKKEPLGPVAIKRQLKMLAKYDEPTAMIIIENSINSNWTGLFPPKNPPTTPLTIIRRVVI
jgi:hypothetical protein